MKPPKTVFVCQECGGQQPKWLGRCPDCDAWNSLVEEQPAPETAPVAAGHRYSLVSGGASAKLYSDIQTSDAPRIPSGIAEFDRVLGGGIVPGGLVLLGGEPGIGKSTLLLQVAAHVARTVGPVLYSSGEESEHQIKLRGERLSVDRSPLYLLAETCLERILEEIERLKPAARDRRFDSDDFLRRVFNRPPAASARCAKSRRTCSSPRRAATCRSCWSGTSRRTAISPGRRRSSTSSIPSSISRASAIMRIVWCALSRTGSGQPASSACSR